MGKIYKASPTMAQFHNNDDFIRGAIGPFGSGKSVAMVMEILMRASRQEPNEDGIRKTMCTVVRNTSKQLKDTTIKTFLQWLPEDKAGTYRRTDSIFILGEDKHRNPYMVPGPPHPDFPPSKHNPTGTWVRCEVLFRALDRPDQQQDLLSLEPSFAWFNEFGEIPFELVAAMSGRVGRYSDGGPCTWKGIFMDSNPYVKDSPYDRLFSGNEIDAELQAVVEKEGLESPKYTLFQQPGGMHPNAENLENLPDGRGYYVKLLETYRREGRSQAWIDRYVHGKCVYLTDGKAIFSEDFDERAHVSNATLVPNPQLAMGVGVDFGVQCSAVFAQMMPSGQWQVFDELTGEGGGAEQFAIDIKNRMRLNGWADIPVYVIGDPAGQQRSQAAGRQPIEMLRAAGLNARLAQNEHQTGPIRLNAVRAVMRRMVSGQPGLLVDRKCKMLIQGFAGGYEYRKMKTSEEKYDPKPNKNKYSHTQDAFQYVIVDFEAPALRGGQVLQFPRALEASSSNRRINYGGAKRVNRAWG